MVFLCFCLCQTAGLHPTAEQIEMFAYHLPDATLSNLIVSITIVLSCFSKLICTSLAFRLTFRFVQTL